jgi:hypothetical protein
VKKIGVKDHEGKWKKWDFYRVKKHEETGRYITKRK